MDMKVSTPYGYFVHTLHVLYMLTLTFETDANLRQTNRNEHVFLSYSAITQYSRYNYFFVNIAKYK